MFYDVLEQLPDAVITDFDGTKTHPGIFSRAAYFLNLESAMVATIKRADRVYTKAKIAKIGLCFALAGRDLNFGTLGLKRAVMNSFARPQQTAEDVSWVFKGIDIKGGLLTNNSSAWVGRARRHGHFGAEYEHEICIADTDFRPKPDTEAAHCMIADMFGQKTGKIIWVVGDSGTDMEMAIRLAREADHHAIVSVSNGAGTARKFLQSKKWPGDLPSISFEDTADMGGALLTLSSADAARQRTEGVLGPIDTGLHEPRAFDVLKYD